MCCNGSRFKSNRRHTIKSRGYFQKFQTSDTSILDVLNKSLVRNFGALCIFLNECCNYVISTQIFRELRWLTYQDTGVLTEQSPFVTRHAYLSSRPSVLVRLHKHSSQGRAIAQAVSRWLPTAAARVRSRVWWDGICGGQNGAGAGLLRFPLPIFIPPILYPHNHPGQVQ
jgi:hypothetical protein